LIPAGIHVLIRREKDHVNADALRHCRIPIKISRVFGKIFFGAKLGGINVDTDNNMIRRPAGFSHQRQMTFMKIAHRRNKRYPFAGKP